MGPAAGGFGGGFGGFGGSGGGGTYRVEDMGDLGDLFGGLFGRGRRGGQQAGPQRGADVETELHLSFEDAVHGVTTSVNLTTDVRCHTCSGSGSAPGTQPETCPRCGGTGTLQDNQGLFSLSQICPQCGGRGTIVTHPCPTCCGHRGRAPQPLGQGPHPGRRRGRPAHPGQGTGAAGRGGGPARRSLRRRPGGPARRVRPQGAQPDPHRAGLLPEATLGTTLTVPTLADPVTLRVPPGTPSGRTFRVKGRGVPGGKKTHAGDLLVTVEVAVPEELTDEQRAAVEALAEVVEPPSRDVTGGVR